MPIPLTEHPDGVGFALKVVPGASRDRIVGALGDALKVAVSAPPEAGAANKAVAALLAAALGVPASAVTVVRGRSTPRKEVRVAGRTAAQVAAALAPFGA
jgi:uncharacterized protein (TIGR00251 family)